MPERRLSASRSASIVPKDAGTPPDSRFLGQAAFRWGRPVRVRVLMYRLAARVRPPFPSTRQVKNIFLARVPGNGAFHWNRYRYIRHSSLSQEDVPTNESGGRSYR